MATQDCILPAIFFIIACIGGALTLYSREILRDKDKTQLFAVIAIMGTVAFVMWALIYL
jgi:hypothetical protein